MEKIYSEISSLKANNKPFSLCIVTETSGSTPRKIGAKMLVLEDGSIVESIGGGSIEREVVAEALLALKTGIPLKKKYTLEDDLSMHCGGTMEIYIEPICVKEKLYIFGAGHIGKAVAHLASEYNFTVVLIDPRTEVISDVQLNNYTKINKDYFNAIEEIPFDENAYSVIVTPKHEFDEDILISIATKPHAYIGMIGSKRKVDIIRKKILDEKLFSEEILQKIDMPIGIKFHAETPAEIGLSIVAKLVHIRNSKKKSISNE